MTLKLSVLTGDLTNKLNIPISNEINLFHKNLIKLTSYILIRYMSIF